MATSLTAGRAFMKRLADYRASEYWSDEDESVRENADDGIQYLPAVR